MEKKKQIIVFLLVFNMLLSIYSIYLNVKINSIKRKNVVLNNKIHHLTKKIKHEYLERFEFLNYRDKNFSKRYPEFSKILNVVYKKSHEYGFSPELILSIIYVESSFNPRAVSPAGAYGLMQINYSVWKDVLKIDFNKIFDIEYNVDLGLKILKHYYEKTNGDMMKALYLYNNGYNYNNFSYNNKVISTIFFK